MNSLFNHAVKQSQLLARDLEKLEAAPEDSPLSLQGQIAASLTAFQRTLENYEQAVNKEANSERQQQGKERTQKFRTELTEARDKFKRLKALREESIANANRNELFARRPAGNPEPENPFGQDPYRDSQYTREDGLARESDVLSRAGQQLDEFIERGRMALSSVGEQNSVLENTQNSLRKAAGVLGISNETIRRVERRVRGDKFIFYFGIFLLLVCFFIIFRYLR